MPGTTANSLSAVSDNIQDPPFDIPKDEITGIALVIGHVNLEQYSQIDAHRDINFHLSSYYCVKASVRINCFVWTHIIKLNIIQI